MIARPYFARYQAANGWTGKFAHSNASSARPRRLHVAGACASGVVLPAYTFISRDDAVELIATGQAVACRACRPDLQPYDDPTTAQETTDAQPA